MALTTNVPSDRFEDLQRDVQDATRFSNATAPYFNRVGQEIKPIPLTASQVEASAALANEQIQDAIDGLINSGWFAAAGSFEAGGTITERNQYLQLVATNGGDVAGGYSWGGALPKTVAPGSTPGTTGGTGANAWVYRSDAVLRSELAAGKIAVGEYVTPQMFGDVGAGANDNALFLSAAATGKKILAYGPVYNLNQLVINSAVDIEFGHNTIINNTQPSGDKKPAIRFIGPGLSGAAVAVTQLGSGSDYRYKSVTVSNSAGFSVGDTVLMRENEPDRAEVGVASPSVQDFNYYEYLTITEIAGNVITFEEAVGGKFDVGNTITIQKCGFLENCHVFGGTFVGGNPAGGGVGFEWCRKSSATSIKARGLSDNLAADERMGGPPILLENCWECIAVSDWAQWTLFSLRVDKIQSCYIEVRGGKRTSNGGLICARARTSYIAAAVQDSPGDVNGDGLGVTGRSWGNTFGAMSISGANCYTLWLRQPAHDNTFSAINSVAGVTAVVNLYGNNNVFQLIKTRGHPSGAVSAEGNGNTINLDYEGTGTGISIITGTTGNKVTGRSNSLSTTTGYDVLLGNVTNTIIDLDCGVRGLVYGAGSVEHFSNNINIRGAKPYRLGVSASGRGWSWTRGVTGVGTTPIVLQVPGVAADTLGLKNLAPTAADAGEVYKVLLKTNTAIADTSSEYLIIGRQGSWALQAIREGASTFAPRITVNATNLEMTLNGSGPLTVFMIMEKF